MEGALAEEVVKVVEEMVVEEMVVKEEEIQMKTITTPQKLIMVQNIYYYYLIVIIQCLKSMYHVYQRRVRSRILYHPWMWQLRRRVSF